MNMLVALDKFKSSASSIDLCRWIAEELQSVDSDWNVVQCPLADGGDGSIAIIESLFETEKITVQTFDPLGREIEAQYLLINDTAFIELATTSGLHLLTEDEYDPYLTSTYGTGVMIRDAISKGVKDVKLFLGGSATIDGAMGILHALGVHFYSENEIRLYPSGESLYDVASINIDVLAKLRETKYQLICDVKSPLLGPSGAVSQYGAQKGAKTVDDLLYFEQALKNIADLIEEELLIDVKALESGGAAGGVAAGLNAFLNAEIISGSDFFIKELDLIQKIEKADMVILGEGKFDAQTDLGKIIGELIWVCEKKKKPFYLICGDSTDDFESDYQDGEQVLYKLRSLAKSKEDSINNVEFYTRKITKSLAIQLL